MRTLSRPGLRKQVLIAVGATLLLLWTMIPIYWIFSISFMNPSERLQAQTPLYPHNPTLYNYQRILGFPARDVTGEIDAPSGHAPIIKRGLRNSLYIATVTTLLTLLISLPAAYALGRLRFPRRESLLFAVVAGRSVPPFAVLIPFYMLFQALGWHGTYTGLIIMDLTVTVPMVIWVMTTFFETLPPSVEREARTDGCTRFGAFYRIILPMARGGIAASACLAFLTAWNEFTFGLLLAAGMPTQPFAPSVAGILSVEMGAGDPAEAAAAMILGMAPSLVLAFIYQRNIRQLNVIQPL